MAKLFSFDKSLKSALTDFAVSNSPLKKDVIPQGASVAHYFSRYTDTSIRSLELRFEFTSRNYTDGTFNLQFFEYRGIRVVSLQKGTHIYQSFWVDPASRRAVRYISNDSSMLSPAVIELFNQFSELLMQGIDHSQFTVEFSSNTPYQRDCLGDILSRTKVLGEIARAPQNMHINFQLIADDSTSKMYVSLAVIPVGINRVDVVFGFDVFLPYVLTITANPESTGGIHVSLKDSLFNFDEDVVPTYTYSSKYNYPESLLGFFDAHNDTPNRFDTMVVSVAVKIKSLIEDLSKRIYAHNAPRNAKLIQSQVASTATTAVRSISALMGAYISTATLCQLPVATTHLSVSTSVDGVKSLHVTSTVFSEMKASFTEVRGILFGDVTVYDDTVLRFTYDPKQKAGYLRVTHTALPERKVWFDKLSSVKYLTEYKDFIGSDFATYLDDVMDSFMKVGT